MEPISVLIVDDHPTVRRGLRSLLSAYQDISVVGEAEDGSAALRVAQDLSPQVVLLDVQLPVMDGIEVARQLRQSVPDTKVIALTAHDDEAHLLGTMRAGAVAYLLKTTSDETLVETIRLVHQGKHIVSPSLMDPVLRRFKELAEAQIRHELGLSDEEIKVLRLISDGATNEEIAQETHWSERTIKREIEEIMSKLGARNRAQAAAEAIRRGLI
ncbi:MAG TPA: response regulator transcription factor [Anaerolineae bacterium]